MTPYNYGSGDPINNFDPSGLKWWNVGGSVCFGICTRIGIGADDDFDFGFAFSVGPKVGFTADVATGAGQREGWVGFVGCGGAAGVAVNGALSWNGSSWTPSPSVSVGGGAEFGCSVGAGFTA